MKKTLFVALFAMLPVVAQDAAPQQWGPRRPADAEMKAKFLEKFDADKDGRLSETEKEAAKAEFGKKRGKRGPRRREAPVEQPAS